LTMASTWQCDGSCYGPVAGCPTAYRCQGSIGLGIVALRTARIHAHAIAVH
jgi:hypothetical protein